MDITKILIIVGIVLGVGILIFFAIKFIKRPTKTKLYLSNKDVIKNNALYCKSLAMYSGLGQNYADRLTIISDKLEYLNPVINKEVELMDKKIKNCLDDIKLIVAVDKINDKKLENKINDLNNLIQERDYKSKLK